MAKVRSQEHMNQRLTNQRLYAALKNVAGVLDQQQIEDSENNVAKVAPSLRRHDTLASYPRARRVVATMADDTTYAALKNVTGIQDLQQIDSENNVANMAPLLCRHDTLASNPRARRVVPSMADDTTMVGESEKASPGPRDESLDEVDQLAGDGATEACTEPEDNDWFDDEIEENNVPVDVVANEEGPPRKKRKGDGIWTMVESLRKSLHPAGGEGASKLKINLVNMPPPPIPTPKGKARATYVPFYLTVTATD